MERFRVPASRHRVGAVIGVAALALSLVAVVPVFAIGGDLSQPVDFLHNNLADAPVPGAVFGTAPAAKIGSPICTTPVSNAANVNTDCEGTGPHNESSIAVNPLHPSNIIGGLNDYQLAVNPGGHLTETTLSRAHVSFDGGKSWTTYPLNATSTYQASGDPAVAFDAAGNAYYATLGFRFVGPGNAQSPDVLVHTSTDGGVHWSQARVASGSGVFTSVGDLLDKEYIAAWGNGNAIVTFGDFRQGQKGSFISAKIYATVTHDAGRTWSTPTVISGSLDEAFVSTPTVTADGRIVVSFLNTTDLATGRDDYMTVEVSPTTGHRIAGPFLVSHVIDGATDYPIALGRQTYQDSTFRTWAAGNITADPTNGAHLAVVFSDMRNSTLPAPANPYAAKTNSDVIVSQSMDHGQTWSAPTALTLSGDQFMPWAAFDTNGLLRIGFFDRSYDSANHEYGFTLATETSAGSSTFSLSQVTTTLSNPTRDDRWFSGATLDASFPHPTSFLGDYSNIAALPGGGVAAYWTDMRNSVSFAGRTGFGEDGYFGAMP
jgi:BNR repeat-like domain